MVEVSSVCILLLWESGLEAPDRHHGTFFTRREDLWLERMKLLDGIYFTIFDRENPEIVELHVRVFRNHRSSDDATLKL